MAREEVETFRVWRVCLDWSLVTNFLYLKSACFTGSGFQFIIKELVEPSAIINLCIMKRDPIAAIRFALIPFGL